jgi:hypothetical protein
VLPCLPRNADVRQVIFSPGLYESMAGVRFEAASAR